METGRDNVRQAPIGRHRLPRRIAAAAFVDRGGGGARRRRGLGGRPA